MSDSSQGSGSPPARLGNAPRAPAAPAAPLRGVTAPVRQKPPAAPPGAGIRPRSASTLDAVPEARRAREPLPDDATVPMRRSDRPASLPPEDAWGDSEKKDASAAETRENPAQAATPNPPPAAASPKPAPVASTQVVTDANSLRMALEEILGPMQRSIDDLTVRMARERVDRKDAIERLERTIARVATATPPPVQVAPAPAYVPPATAPAAPPAQPFTVSPSAHPPPVAPVAVAPPTPSPVPPPVAKPASPPPPPVVAKAPSPPPPPAAPTAAPSQPLNLDVIEGAPHRIELDKYSTDLGFDLPPGLDSGKRRKRMLIVFFVVVVSGVVAIVASAIISQSRGPGHSLNFPPSDSRRA
ncbi:MAG: hypothetical protein ACRELY_27760 [Polyangiaceae bacterium]